LLATDAWAQDTAAEVGVGQKASATLRTLREMQASDAAHPTIPTFIAPNLPTMDLQEHVDLKGGGPARGQVKPEAGQAQPTSSTLGPLNCDGIGQSAAGGFFPPDTHGAVGVNHYGEIVRSRIRFYTKDLTGSCPTGEPVMDVTLDSFFNYFTQGITNPRLLYDLTYNRWIVSAVASPESSIVQYQFIAVSVDSDPTHGFFFYGDSGAPVGAFNAHNWIGPTGKLWEYPQIGYDEDAVILTGNKIGRRNFFDQYIGSTAVFLSKHRMYAALDLFYSVFNDDRLNVGTLTPPIVLDQGPYTTIASVAVDGDFIRVTKWNNTAHFRPNLLGKTDISVSTRPPPLAPQPGYTDCRRNGGRDVANCLDTGDGRFQSQGTQFGMPAFGVPVRFWQVHTKGESSFAVARAYQVNADRGTIERTWTMRASANSFDFNPSIVTTPAGVSWVTWSATDPTHNDNPMVWIQRQVPDAGIAFQVLESEIPMTGNFDPNLGCQAWGGSAITLDPLDPNTVYGVNEKVILPGGFYPTRWKSHIFNAHDNP